ncbi:MAG: flagellar motor switch protein FliG [Oscillospiraceae bacterium]|jgi:flagellar motor switch protein FliG
MAGTAHGDISGAQRAATVITAMGAENAALVYKYLNEEDIEKLTFEISKLAYFNIETVDGILTEYYELCLTQKYITEGGVEYARTILEKAFGESMAGSLMDKVTKSLKTKAFDFMRKADAKNMLAIVQNEHPQTIALILSYVRADQASSVLAELPKDKRVDVVERIAKMDSASPEVIKAIEETLEKKFSSIVTMDIAEVGGVNYIADVLNHVDRGTEKFIFDELSTRDPELVNEIRQKMFVFEDILNLDENSIQRFIRDVDTKDLAIAIKGSTPEVTAVLFANMPQRMQETIQSDIEYLHNVRMRDVEEAQQRIVAVIRRLEEEGELVIGKGGKDEIIA